MAEYSFQISKEIVQALQDGAISNESGTCANLQGKYANAFLEKIAENEKGVENIKLVPTHGVVYPPNRRKSTVYMRVNSYCMTCRGCVSKESSASYIITINNETPAVEHPNYLNVKVVRRNEHQHKHVESNAPPSKRVKKSASTEQVVATSSSSQDSFSDSNCSSPVASPIKAAGQIRGKFFIAF
jgi:hypothetical protein